MLSEDDKSKIFKEYEKYKNQINIKEEYEAWRKMKYDNRCYPFRRLVGLNINEK